MKDKCSNSVYHEHKDLLDDHNDIMKQIKSFNASKAKLKNNVDREKEEDISVEKITIADNLKNGGKKIGKFMKQKLCEDGL